MDVQEIGGGIRQKTGDNISSTSSASSAETIDRFIRTDYKIELLHSKYDRFLYDSFINFDYLDETNTTADYNDQDYIFSSNSSSATTITTVNYALDEVTNFGFLKVNYENNTDDTTILEQTVFKISTDDGSSWQEVTPETDIEFSSSVSQFKVKIELPALDGLDIYSFAILFDQISPLGSSPLTKKMIDDTAKNKYKIELYQLSYSQMIVDSFISDANIDSVSDVELSNQFGVVVPNGADSATLESTVYTLSSGISELKLASEYNLNDGSIEILVSNDGGSNYVSPDSSNICTFSSTGTDIKLKATLTKGSDTDISPIFYSYGLFV